jgi:predicted esterase
VFRVYNNLYASDSPIEPNKERWAAILDAYKMDGRLLFDLSNQEHVARREEILSLLDTIDLPVPIEEGLESRQSILTRTRGLEVWTDDNMGEEWMPPMFQEAYDYISNKF